jgi:hypothetical protein
VSRDGSVPPTDDDETDASPPTSGDHDRDRDSDTGRDGDGVDRAVRRGSVDLRTRDGEVVHHDETYVRYDRDAFVLSPDRSFPADGTERYPKEAVAWIQVRHPR